jgi:hypothetical protein
MKADSKAWREEIRAETKANQVKADANQAKADANMKTMQE